MIRKTLTVLSLIGLLLSVGMWAGVTEVFGMTETIGNHLCICKRGVLLTFTPTLPMRRHVSGFIEETRTPADARLAWVMYQQKAVEVMNRYWESWSPSFRWNGQYRLGYLPFWIPTLCFAIYPAYLLTPLHHRRKRRKLGLCLKCGYDLRGSEERCPECGRTL